MRKKLFTFLLALVTSVGLMNAQSGGISVTEFNVPDDWENAEAPLLESDLPGFGAADSYTTQRWNEVPSGEVYLIYAFESDGRVKYHKFSNGVRYASPTNMIGKPEIFWESNSGTKYYYTTGPSNWGPEQLPQVSEITNPPSEWYQDNTYISTDEMPGFVTVDDEIVKAWNGAPQGSAILISSVGNVFKYHNFRDGVYQYTKDDPLTRNTVYFNITDTEIAGRFFYTTGTIPGGSTPTPANSCGDGLTWELNAGVFTISYDGVGTGVMDDFDYSEHPAPWQSSKESITSVIIPDGVTRIGNNAFSGAYNLASVSMGDDVVAIGNNAFEACNSLSSITLSSHVTTIGDHAFAGLQSLTSIVLPSTVQSIGMSAFYGNEGLTSITCEGTTPPTLGQYVFGMIGNGATLYVPYGYAETYESADSQWQALNVQVIGSGSASYPYCGDGLTWTYNNGVLTIIYDGVGTGDMLDYGNYNIYPWDSYKDDITSVIIPDGVRRIGNYAFANLINLASVSMGDDVVEIGYGGFWNCLSLQSITLGSHVTTIGEHAFGSNHALTSITLPNTLQTIGGSAFYNCNSLPTITIPSSVTSFGDYAFGFCEGLTSFTCEGTTPPTLGQDVFTMVPYYRPLYVPNGYVETYQGANSQWQKFDISVIPAPTPDPDPTPTPSATGVIFANCYDCWRSPEYPTISGQCYLHNFGNPGVGNGNPSGPWKLEFVENYNSSSTEYDSNIVKSDVAISEYGKNPAEMEVYRLYQWQNGAYQPVAYGVLYAYANESNPVEHAAFFEASGYWGCYLTDNTHSNGDNFNILFNEDASTGFADLHGGSTSANPEIKLYADFSGNFENTDAFMDNGNGTATLTIPNLEARHNAIFVKKDGVEMSSGHNFTRENPSANVSGNQLAMWFDTDEAGEYTFTFEYSTNILTITYPTATPTPTPSDDANKLPGAFSVSGTKVVYFSKGNLQATTNDLGATWTWGFAENQYDVIGDAVANKAINGGGTVSSNGAVDLFGWSSNANNYYGINNSMSVDDYSGNFQDWGAKMGSDWRTLNGAQWEYLLHTREPGSSAGGTSNPRFTRATILTDGTAPSQNIFGLILFPDNFNDGGEYIDGVTWNGINSYSSYVSPTSCTTAGWATLESMGCVFLPAPGWRSGNEVTNAGAFGIYWSSSKYSEEDASCIYFSNTDVSAFHSYITTGASVRLVSETAPSPAPAVDPAVQNVIDLINAIPNPVVYTQECYNALDAVYEAYRVLSPEQKDQVTNYDDYVAAEERYYMLGSVNYVIEKINEIGNVEFTSECKHRIDYARSEYCSLTLEQKGYVTNYNTLLAAEAAYAALIPVSSTVVWDEAILETIDVDEGNVTTFTNNTISLKAVDGHAYYVDNEQHFLLDGSSSEKSFVFSCTSANILRIEITVYEKYQDNELSCAWQETATGYRWVGEATSVDFASTIFKVTEIRFYLGEAFPEPTPTPAQDGDKLPGAFSVSGGKVVYFSKGNLQYLGNIERWHFAENQWTIIGNAQASDNRDLFSWGTGDNPDSEDYSTYTEWGNNIEGNWRTLTVDEWTYLFNTRTDASSKYGTATVAGVVGLILLPDVYDGTAINTDRTAWDNNVISSSAWAAYEAAGAVFLPAAGLSDAFGVYGVGEQGFYWSSTMDALSHDAISVFYGFDNWEGYWFNQVDAQFQPQEGHSVRLVSETAPTPASTPNSIVINGTPAVGDNSISLTYYFDPANVPGICCFAPTLKVKCVEDGKYDEIWLSLSEIKSGTTTITLEELVSFQEGKTYQICFACCVNNVWHDEVFQTLDFNPTPTAVEIGDLNNAEEVTAFLTTYEGQLVPDLTIDRPVLNNMYNTLCLPFHMDADQIANSSLNGVEIYEFINVDVTNDELYLYTSEQKHEIVAGRPYLVKFSAASQLDELNFIDVVINNADLDNQAVTIKGVTFKGTFQPIVLGAQEGLNFNGGHLFLMANNTLMWPNTNNPLKPFRAYFTVNVDAGQSAGMPVRRGMPAHIGGLAQIPTGVDQISQEPGQTCNSQKLIENGVLYIIKNGVKYNAQGQIVK